MALRCTERGSNSEIPFTAAYGDLLRTLPDTAAVEGPRLRAGDALFTNALFGDYQSASFANGQTLDEEGETDKKLTRLAEKGINQQAAMAA